ncbi:MAG TPA: FliM/FliN family flagellar motor switch protein [Gaiellales bacterium]|jgi:flagellar motor switch protein FliM|nr:FliM/FliN family flagellar motor switch protein [Gaiellales bacterium]
MSGDVLSNDQVEALVQAAKQGQAGARPEAPARSRRARRVREIDFSRPSKFAQDQQRRLERAHEAFCRLASQQLSAELLTEIEMDVLGVDQLTWSTAIAQVPQPSLNAIVDVRPLGTQVLMSTELSLLLRLVERLLGGTGTGMMRPRELTEIEMALVRRVLSSLLEQLTVTWDELVGVNFGLLELESQISTVHLAPPSEPTLVLTLEVKVDKASSTLSLVFPYRSIEQVLPQLSGSQYGEVHIDPSTAGAVRAGVAGVDVEMRAEVASTALPIDQVLALRPGDVLRFRAPASEGVTLFAGHVPAHRARPGRNGNWRAVQIVERLGGEE